MIMSGKILRAISLLFEIYISSFLYLYFRGLISRPRLSSPLSYFYDLVKVAGRYNLVKFLAFFLLVAEVTKASSLLWYQLFPSYDFYDRFTIIMSERSGFKRMKYDYSVRIAVTKHIFYRVM